MAEREIFLLEDSLKDYMINEIKLSGPDRETVDLNRYRNLKFMIDTEDQFAKIPHFKIQVSLLEAYFTIEEAIKLSGSLGAFEENLVREWLRRGSNKDLLRMFWSGESVDKKKSKIVPFDLE